MDSNYAGEDLKPTVLLASLKSNQALSANPPRVMPRNRRMGKPKGSSSPSNSSFPFVRSEGVLNIDSSMPSADPPATVILKMRELEQQQQQGLRTRNLLQPRQQDVLDDACLALANASSSESMLGSVPYSLMGGRLGLDRQHDILDDAYLAAANASSSGSMLGGVPYSLTGGRLGLNHHQHVLEDAYLAALNATSSENMIGNTFYLLAGGRLGLDHDTQDLLQKRLQMESGLLPPHSTENLRGKAGLGGDAMKQRNPYFDASQAPGPPSGEEDLTTEQSEPFPQKLYRMLEEVEESNQEDILSFSPDGRAFAIHKPDIFTEAILPRYFNTNLISSFHRQLHHYGFRRIKTGQDKGYYYHKYFLKGRKELAKNIECIKSAGPKLSREDLEEVVRIYREAPSRAGFDIGIPASQLQNSVHHQDLISRSLMLHGGHQSRRGNSLSGLPSDVVDGLSRQRDLIRQSLTMRGGEQQPQLRSSLSRLPPSLMEGLSSRQQDFISQSLRMQGDGHSPRVGNSLSGLRSSVMEGFSAPRLSFESLTQGDNGALRSVSGQSGDLTTAALLRELKESELLLARFEERRQRMSGFRP